MGFLYADGSIKRDQELILALQAKDVGHLEAFKRAIQSEHQIRIVERSGYEIAWLRIGSQKLCKTLRNLGYRDQVPQFVDEKLAKHFIRGLFDGDGSVSTSGQERIFSLLSRKALLEFARDKLRKHCGLNPGIKNVGGTYELRCSGNQQIKQIGEFLYSEATVFLLRKAVRFPEGMNLRLEVPDFWEYNTRPFPGAHFAVFPEAICLRPILSSSRPGDIVLDPFCGAGTTLAVAKKLGRKAIGIDLVAEYCQMSKEYVTRLESETITCPRDGSQVLYTRDTIQHSKSNPEKNDVCLRRVPFEIGEAPCRNCQRGKLLTEFNEGGENSDRS
ncbi:hypothetical protein M1O17_05360 [Dehalococcoidia bacterium]|nr:hypothetical protein [Dehalococcoidia bacterium]